jgi:tetratricopeptide (TPR) repeat protein
LLFALMSIAPMQTLYAEPSSISDAEDKRNADLLVFAKTLITQGKPQQAIDQYLDPMIARYTAQYSNEKRRIYVAWSVEETLNYMLRAAADHRSAITLGPTWGDALYLKAFALVYLGKRDEAEAIYKQGLEMAPDNFNFLAELGSVRGQAGDWPGSLAYFEQAMKATAFSNAAVRPVFLARAMRGAGFSLIELGRLDEAEALFKRCLAINKNDEMAKNELSFIAQRRASQGRTPPLT